MIQIRKSSYRSLLLVTLTAALAVPAFSVSALADDAPSTEVAAGRHFGTPVSVSGNLARYVVGPLGNVRGFILKDGTAVMIHGKAGDAMAKAVQVGQSVKVDGMGPADGANKVVFRVTVYGPNGDVVVAPPQRGEEPRDPAARKERFAELRADIMKLPEASANGTVETVVPGRHGKTMAVVLTDGTSVFLRPGLARAVMAHGIKAGDKIESSGRGARYAVGSSVVVGSITFADGAHFEARAPQAT
jgi:hypothetical protein